jgi:hypothetical protein
MRRWARRRALIIDGYGSSSVLRAILAFLLMCRKKSLMINQNMLTVPQGWNPGYIDYEASVVTFIIKMFCIRFLLSDCYRFKYLM